MKTILCLYNSKRAVSSLVNSNYDNYEVSFPQDATTNLKRDIANQTG